MPIALDISNISEISSIDFFNNVNLTIAALVIVSSSKMYFPILNFLLTLIFMIDSSKLSSEIFEIISFFLIIIKIGCYTLK